MSSVSSVQFSTINSWISIPVWRAPPCTLNKTSSPTLREVTGTTVLDGAFPENKLTIKESHQNSSNL